jgi:SAM-dependent methyltransferase
MNTDLIRSMSQYYRERVPEYDEVYRGRGPASISEPDTYEHEVAILSDVVRRTLSGNLIDLACGTAFWLPGYAVNIDRVTLLDQSHEMLAAARARAESAGILDRSTVVCGDVFNRRIETGPFDWALVGFLISHFTSEQEACFFRVLRPLLKPGGGFLVLDSVWTKARARVRNKEGPQERRLKDGRRFRIYKKYFEERDLMAMEEIHSITLVTEYFGTAFFTSRGAFRNR